MKFLQHIRMSMKTTYIYSWEDLQKNVQVILKELNQDENLTLAAAANPILALKELGYEIDSSIRWEVEMKLRFRSLRKQTRLKKLQNQIFKLAGKRFDLESAESLKGVLFTDLKIPIPVTAKNDRKNQQRKIGEPIVPNTAPLPIQNSYTVSVKDPLDILRGKHEIIDSLLEYRQLEASKARFAPVNTYEAIRNRKMNLPITKIKARLKS